MKLKNLFGHNIALVKKQNNVVKCHFLVRSKEYGQVCLGFGHSEGPAINYSGIWIRNLKLISWNLSDIHENGLVL